MTMEISTLAASMDDMDARIADGILGPRAARRHCRRTQESRDRPRRVAHRRLGARAPGLSAGAPYPELGRTGVLPRHGVGAQRFRALPRFLGAPHAAAVVPLRAG